MAGNKFFTIMIVPEKSNQVTKIVLPGYVFKGAILAVAFLTVLAVVMILDYANVMGQINENKQLKTENRQLRQSVQVFKNKIVTIDNTLERVKTFVTKLRIITNIEDTSNIPITPPQPAPQMMSPGMAEPSNLVPMDEEKNRPTGQPKKGASAVDPSADVVLSHATTDSDVPDEAPAGAAPAAGNHRSAESQESPEVRRKGLLAKLMTAEAAETFTMTDADASAYVTAEFEKLDTAYDEVNRFALAAEQETHDVLEKLSQKRALLASTPTRIPTLGYISSDYGVRISPYDGRRKIHEGIDIANRFGADVIAPADGIVTFAGNKPGYGKVVVVDHGNGLETRYAHNSRLYVEAGYKVHRGDRIAAVGNTGHSTGPHCHYEVHANGLPVDPCWYILDQPQLCRGR